eukprot:IDg12526t1
MPNPRYFGADTFCAHCAPAPTENTAETASLHTLRALLFRAHSTHSPLLSRVPLLRSVAVPRDCSHLLQGLALKLGSFTNPCLVACP